MDYVKDEFGNIIGYKGDDLSQQQAKLAGIPQGQAEKPVNNIFAGLSNQQERNMTYTSDDLQRGYKAVVPNQQAQQSVNSPSGHENVGHGNEVAMPRLVDSMTATPKVQTVAQTPQYSQPRPQITNMDELASAMGYTSPEEEARLRKASVNNQRILAVADALRHIGNIANTVNYAPAQRFNQPWAEEQLRYEHGKAQRDRANQAIISYQQQRAELDRKIKQAEAEAARKERQMAFEREKWEAQKPYHEHRGKTQEYIEGIKKLEYESTPDMIASRKKAQDALAYQRESGGNAAMIKANAYASDRADASRKRGYSGGGSGGSRSSSVSSGSSSSAPIRFSGRKGSYARKQQPTNKEIDDMYQDAVSRGYVDTKNQQMVATGQQTKAQVINKVATYVKDSDKFFDRHGYTKVRDEDKPAKPTVKPAAKPAAKGGSTPRKPNPNGQRQTKMVKGRDGKEREYELDSKGKIVINY